MTPYRRTIAAGVFLALMMAGCASQVEVALPAPPTAAEPTLVPQAPGPVIGGEAPTEQPQVSMQEIEEVIEDFLAAELTEQPVPIVEAEELEVQEIVLDLPPGHAVGGDLRRGQLVSVVADVSTNSDRTGPFRNFGEFEVLSIETVWQEPLTDADIAEGRFPPRRYRIVIDSGGRALEGLADALARDQVMLATSWQGDALVVLELPFERALGGSIRRGDDVVPTTQEVTLFLGPTEVLSVSITQDPDGPRASEGISYVTIAVDRLDLLMLARAVLADDITLEAP